MTCVHHDSVFISNPLRAARYSFRTCLTPSMSAASSGETCSTLAKFVMARMQASRSILARAASAGVVMFKCASCVALSSARSKSVWSRGEGGGGAIDVGGETLVAEEEEAMIVAVETGVGSRRGRARACVHQSGVSGRRRKTPGPRRRVYRRERASIHRLQHSWSASNAMGPIPRMAKVKLSVLYRMKRYKKIIAALLRSHVPSGTDALGFCAGIPVEGDVATFLRRNGVERRRTHARTCPGRRSHPNVCTRGVAVIRRVGDARATRKGARWRASCFFF